MNSRILIHREMLDTLNGSATRTRAPHGRAREQSAAMEQSAALKNKVLYKHLQADEGLDAMFLEVHCTICLDDFVDAALVPCRHVFCFDCIVEWSKVNNKCPMCRSQLDPRFMVERWKRVNIERLL